MLVGLVDPISVHSPPSQPVVDTVGSLIPTRQMRPLRLGEGLRVNIATLTELLLGPRREVLGTLDTLSVTFKTALQS